MSKKGTILEAGERSDDQAFLNIGYFTLGGHWISLFLFDV